MKYVKQIDKYTLATTNKLTSKPIYYSMDNLTHEKVHDINNLLSYMQPTVKNLEFILATIEHDGDNLKSPVDPYEYMYKQLMQIVTNPLL